MSQLALLNETVKLQAKIGELQFDDFNEFKILVGKGIKELKLKLDSKALKGIYKAVSWRDEDAEPVVKKTEKDGTIQYEADSELRDS